MEYSFATWIIRDLLKMHTQNLINLHPSYQRNFIWGKKDQTLLVDSINNNFPMPNFFIRDMRDGTFEMIDGQQRATTILKYIKNEFTDSNRHKFSDIDNNKFLDYKLNVVLVYESDVKVIEQFFYLVNKRGVHLNPAEINHAYYHDSSFMNIVNRVLEEQDLVDLDIFSDKVVARMNDSSLIEELVAYLISGITDKRLEVDRLHNSTISPENQEKYYQRFCEVLNKLSTLNSLIPINQTRYKQRNDFYTLFCFIDQHIDEPEDLLAIQYKLLVFLSKNELISPSSECDCLKEYAIHCVSQSNSSNARKERLAFFNTILHNTDVDDKTVRSLRSYLYSEYDRNFKLNQVYDYYIIDVPEDLL